MKDANLQTMMFLILIKLVFQLCKNCQERCSLSYSGDIQITRRINYNGYIIYANGNALLPVIVFSRVRYDAAKMTHGTSDKAESTAYSSDWITSQNFVYVLNYF